MNTTTSLNRRAITLIINDFRKLKKVEDEILRNAHFDQRLDEFNDVFEIDVFIGRAQHLLNTNPSLARLELELPPLSDRGLDLLSNIKD